METPDNIYSIQLILWILSALATILVSFIAWLISWVRKADNTLVGIRTNMKRDSEANEKYQKGIENLLNTYGEKLDKLSDEGIERSKKIAVIETKIKEKVK